MDGPSVMTGPTGVPGPLYDAISPGVTDIGPAGTDAGRGVKDLIVPSGPEGRAAV